MRLLLSMHTCTCIIERTKVIETIVYRKNHLVLGFQHNCSKAS